MWGVGLSYPSFQRPSALRMPERLTVGYYMRGESPRHVGSVSALTPVPGLSKGASVIESEHRLGK